MYIEVEGIKIFSCAFGNPKNPVIFAIGGWIGSWELWLDPFVKLSQEYYVVTFDHRGSGSTICDPKNITFENLVKDVFHVMEYWEIEKCSLAGESFGSIVCIAAALSKPEAFTNLILVGGPFYPRKSSEDPFLIALQKDYEKAISDFVEWCVPEKDKEEIKIWGQQILDRANPGNAVKLYSISKEIDLTEKYPTLQHRILLIHGSDDLLAPIEGAKKFASAVPNTQLVVLEGFGHVPTLTAPQSVVKYMKEFFIA